MNQKGLTPILFLPIILVLLISLYVAAIHTHKPFNPLVNPLPPAASLIPSQTATPNPKPPIETAKPSPAKINNPAINITSTSDNLSVNGSFLLGGSYKLNYEFNFPKKGGAISGSTTGSCDTTINGNQDVPDTNGDANFTGQAVGTCQPIAGLGFKTNAKINLSGTVHYKIGRIDVVYDVIEPYQTHSSFEIPFTP